MPLPSRRGSGEAAPGKLAGEVFTGGGRGMMRQRVSHAGVAVRAGGCLSG